MSKQIYFHEDDYCQIELLPAEAWEFAKQQLIEINNFAESHRADNGAGYTDSYVRVASPRTLAELKLTADSVKKALTAVGSFYDEVSTDYGSHEEPLSNTTAIGTARGKDGESVVFFDEKNGLVLNVWFLFEPESAEFVEATMVLLEAFRTLDEFILVDWGWGQILDLRDKQALEQYLIKLKEAY